MRPQRFWILPLALLLIGCGQQVSKGVEARTASSKYEGPLGLKMGLTAHALEQLGLQKLSAPNAYHASTVPKPLSSIDTYFLEIGPRSGLCVISAVYKQFRVNSFGDQLKSEYNNLNAAISEKYGAPSSVLDFVRAGSVFLNPEHFMLGIESEERVLSASWSNNNLPHDLREISIQAAARDIDSAYIVLREGLRCDQAVATVSTLLRQNRQKVDVTVVPNRSGGWRIRIKEFCGLDWRR